MRALRPLPGILALLALPAPDRRTSPMSLLPHSSAGARHGPAPATVLQVRTVRFAAPLGARTTAEAAAAADAAVNAALRDLAARGEEVVAVQAVPSPAGAGRPGAWYEVAYAVVVRAPLAGETP